MQTFYINGKFTAQRMTGVQRVAWSLVRALDSIVPSLPGRWVLLCPRTGAPPPLDHVQPRRLGPPGLPLHVWEQTCLPWAARSGLLISLAGSAAFYGRRQACLIHDAAVFDHPEAYARIFVAWYRLLFARWAGRAQPLMTVSDYSAQRLGHHLHIGLPHICLVPNGADHLNAVQPDSDILAALGLNGRPFLLAVASDNPTKNLPALLAAFAQLPPQTDVRLVLVGGRNARVFAPRPGAPDPARVVRAGPVGDRALKALYQGAVALVFPSLYEGFGLPPLEAMACGCPVLAARAAAVPEVCGDAALYFDPESVPDMAAAMGLVLRDDKLRDSLRLAGQRRAARFGWAASAHALMAALAAGRSGA